MATTQPLILNNDVPAETDSITPNTDYLDDIIGGIDEQEQTEQQEQEQQAVEKEQKQARAEKKEFENSIYTEQEFIDGMIGLFDMARDYTELESLDVAQYDTHKLAFIRLYHICKRNRLLSKLIIKTDNNNMDLLIVLGFMGAVGHNVYKEKQFLKSHNSNNWRPSPAPADVVDGEVKDEPVNDFNNDDIFITDKVSGASND